MRGLPLFGTYIYKCLSCKVYLCYFFVSLQIFDPEEIKMLYIEIKAILLTMAKSYSLLTTKVVCTFLLVKKKICLCTSEVFISFKI